MPRQLLNKALARSNDANANHNSIILSPDEITALNAQDLRKREQLWINFNDCAGDQEAQKELVFSYMEEECLSLACKANTITVSESFGLHEIEKVPSDNFVGSTYVLRPHTVTKGPESLSVNFYR